MSRCRNNSAIHEVFFDSLFSFSFSVLPWLFVHFSVLSPSPLPFPLSKYTEGDYLTAREVGGTIRAVTYARTDIPNMVDYLRLPVISLVLYSA